MNVQGQVGGAVRPGGAYVPREADRLLPEALAAGELCYVLAPRQIGKSSLRIRAAATLASQGLRVASVDLSGLGAAGLEPEGWFFGLLAEIDAALGGVGLEARWEALAGRPPAARWLAALEALIEGPEAPDTVIFLDEIDAVLALPFGGADLFGAIRAAWDRRASDARWGRLRFALLGVAAPGDLIQDPRRTPFNVGRGVRLEDFTPAEAAALLPALPGGAADAPLLAEVLAWTSGHPYQTQQVIQALREAPPGAPQAQVAAVVARLYHGDWPDPGVDAAGRALREADDDAALLVYRRCLVEGGVPPDPRAPAQTALLLSGLVAIRNGRLASRNRILGSVYDLSWVESRLGRRDLRRRAWRWIEAGRPASLLATREELGALLASVQRADLDREEAELVARSEAWWEAEASRRQAGRLRRALLALAAVVLLALLWSMQTRRHADRIALAGELSQLPALAAMPGKQERALRQALTGWRRLADTPLSAIAARALADTTLSARALPVGRGAAGATLWLADGSLWVGRHDGRLERQDRDGRWQGVAQLAGGVTALAGGPTGVLVGGAEGDLLWWDAKAARLTRPPTRPHQPGPARGCILSWDESGTPGVRRLGLSRDGALGWSLSGDGQLALWETGEPLVERLRLHGVTDAELSEDGALLAVARDDGRLVVLDLHTGEERLARGPWPGNGDDPDECVGYAGSPQALLTLSAVPGGERLLVTGRKGVARLIDWTGQAPELALGDATMAIVASAASPDGERVATAALDGEVALWDARTGRALQRHHDHRQHPMDLQFSPDGALLASTGTDDTVQLVDVASGARVWRAAVASGTGLGLAFSPDSGQLAVASPQGLVRLSTGPAPGLARVRTPDRGRPSALDVAPDGAVAVAWTDGPGQVLGPDGAPDPRWPIPPEPAVAVRFSPDGRRLLWMGRVNSLLVDAAGGAPMALAGTGVYWTTPWSRDGERLLLRDGATAVIYDAAGAERARLPERVAPGPALSPDGRWVAAALSGGRLGLFETETGQLAGEVNEVSSRYTVLTWRPDGGELVVGVADQWVRWPMLPQPQPAARGLGGGFAAAAWAGDRLWTARRGGETQRWGATGGPQTGPVGHAATLRSLAASPGGSVLASSDESGLVQLWSAQGEVLAAWPALSAVARHVAFSGDGRALWVAGDDGSLVKLPGSPEALVVQLCGWFAAAELDRPAECDGPARAAGARGGSG